MESCRQCKCWSLPVDARWWIKNNQWKLNISCRFFGGGFIVFFCWEVLWKHPENWGSDEGNCVDYFFINWVAIMLFSWLWNHYGHFYLVVAYYNPYSNRTSDAPSLVATGIQGWGGIPQKKGRGIIAPRAPALFSETTRIKWTSLYVHIPASSKWASYHGINIETFRISFGSSPESPVGPQLKQLWSKSMPLEI